MIGQAEIEGLMVQINLLIAKYPSHAAFAWAVGIDKGQVHLWQEKRWRDVRYHPHSLTLIRVCLDTSVSADWLLLGRGPMPVRTKGISHSAE